MGDQDLRARVGELESRGRRTLSVSKRKELLHELVEIHTRAVEAPDAEEDGAQDELASRTRQAFLVMLRDQPEILSDEELAEFLAEYVKPADFAGITWKSPDDAVRVAEVLHSSHLTDALSAERQADYIRQLLRDALAFFEKRGDFEQMFQLLRLAHIPPTLMNAELLRMRNRVHLYEMRQVIRKRRILFGYLIAQAILILVVFPLLFINAENHRIQNEIEQATQVDVSQEGEGYQRLSYFDGVYWSLITAGSIGYGDITPQTQVGKIIAALLGTLGVITVGVVAGLILNWITPRRLE
jgi:hypothetical protein